MKSLAANFQKNPPKNADCADLVSTNSFKTKTTFEVFKIIGKRKKIFLIENNVNVV